MSATSVAGVMACNTILPVLCIVAVSLRFHVRSTQKMPLKLDDWLQIPALLLFIGMCIAALYGATHHAFGYPTPKLPPTEPAQSLLLCEKLWFIIQILQIWALATIKIAALLFYRRIFVPSARSSILNVIILAFIGIIILWAIGFTAFDIAACGSHVSAAWSGFIGFATYCIKTEKFEQAYAISDFIIDTFLLAIPLPSIWSLHMSIARKISITCVFMFALIGYGASIARLVVFVQNSQESLKYKDQLPDVQINNTEAVWFSALETGFAIFALNLPSIWPLISNISVESIVNSVRSMATLGSNNGSRSSRNRTYNDISATKQNPTAESRENIELVPQLSTDYRATTEGDWKRSNELSDVEDGIHVKKSVDVTARIRPGV